MAIAASRGEVGSAYSNDAVLQPFFGPSFDAADFLNSALPSWTASPSKATDNVISLAELSIQTQSLLSQLNAQLTRLSNTLTQLTDEILRSGGRLAYEVEVLKADTAGLSDVLADGLHNDIQRFLPAGLNLIVPGAAPISTTTQEDVNGSSTPQKPEYITKLQTLTLVRTRLESVIKVFGEAAEWTLLPSEMTPSSLISMATPTSVEVMESKEANGQKYAEKLRMEITDLVSESVDGNGQVRIEAAMRRIDAIRELALVWKGTAEERARKRFVDGLADIVRAQRP